MSSSAASFPSFDEAYALILNTEIHHKKNEVSRMEDEIKNNAELLEKETEDYEENQKEIPVLFAQYKFLLEELETAKKMGSQVEDLKKELKREKEATDLIAIDYEFALDEGANMEIYEKNLTKDFEDLKQLAQYRKKVGEEITAML